MWPATTPSSWRPASAPSGPTVPTDAHATSAIGNLTGTATSVRTGVCNPVLTDVLTRAPSRTVTGVSTTVRASTAHRPSGRGARRVTSRKENGGSADDRAREGAGRLPVVEHDDAVDEHSGVPLGVDHVAPAPRREVLDIARLSRAQPWQVEEHEVGGRTGPHDAPVAQPVRRGVHAREPGDGLFE